MAGILRIEGKTRAEVSVLLVDNATIKKLNRKYRGLNRTTDVLAFSQQEGGYRQGNPDLLGDVVISIDKTLSQSRQYKQPFKKELCLYIIHGCLHLSGYDDIGRQRRSQMNKRQQEILDKLELEGLCG
ncbi:MAG: rRNA maturation RNase YbeY [Candidatus Omnitrophota bacterium]|nr:rRNA maturation RNase YbeY [Candidatus Omnitrophota bacterium]